MSIGLASKLITNAVRLSLAGRSAKFSFFRTRLTEFPKIKKCGIYIHVPFCKQLCPYCPYNRIKYDSSLVAKYIEAIQEEIRYYARFYPELDITSIYFGGGTPTVLDKDIEKIVEALRTNFKISGPLCIETNPIDLSHEKVQLLKSLGFHAVSLGIESFDNNLLGTIGRKYTPGKIDDILMWLEDAKFLNVNIDLMFALPGQNLNQLHNDMVKAITSCASQITAYPLLLFPYSSVGQFLRLRNIKMPGISQRRTMYYYIYDYLIDKGYKRVSVWSFKRSKEGSRFSSVTRERYIGFGPGAGSYYGTLFTLNTFSVQEYIASIKEKGHAVALEMPFTSTLSILYDFYWRLYDTYLPKKRELENLTYLLNDIKGINLLLTLGRLLGMLADKGKYFELTREGSFWIHLLQNYFVLPYINTIWTEARHRPWPDIIKF